MPVRGSDYPEASWTTFLGKLVTVRLIEDGQGGYEVETTVSGAGMFSTTVVTAGGTEDDGWVMLRQKVSEACAAHPPNDSDSGLI